MMRRIIVWLVVIFALIISAAMAQEKMQTSVFHDPPPPFVPDPNNQYIFPTGTSVAKGDPWLNLPPIDFAPPPFARYLKGLRICLDPGHGGYQHLKGYKSTASGYREAIMNLEVARYLREFLLKSGVTVVMTRDGDWDLKKDYSEALAARPMVAEIGNCDFFISMHHNATSNSETNFSSAFYHAFPGYSYSDIDLGRTIVNEIEYWQRLPGFAGTGLYSDYLIYNNAGFAVLRQAKVPAILIEASFFSNPDEEVRLKNPDYLKREAWAYYIGIAKYVRDGMPKAELVSPPDGILTGKEQKVQFHLMDGCPEGWGSKGTPRIVKWSLNLTINDLNVPFEYDETGGILTYQPPQPLQPGKYDFIVRFVNMRKNSNIPKVFTITIQP